jgi:hypothetical protein
MEEPDSELKFHANTLIFKFRDFFFPRRKILEEAGIKPSFFMILSYPEKAAAGHERAAQNS